MDPARDWTNASLSGHRPSTPSPIAKQATAGKTTLDERSSITVSHQHMDLSKEAVEHDTSYAEQDVGDDLLTQMNVEKRGDQIIISYKPWDPEHPHNWSKRWKVLMFVAGALSIVNSSLGSSFPSGAIDQISQQFGVNHDLQLVLPISCYLIGYIIGPSICGPLSEYYGRKRVMVVGFTFYILFTMACAVAPDWSSFLFFRFVCGTAASGPSAIVGGLYVDIYPDARARGFAMAWFTCGTACGPVLAPLLAGFIGQATSWRWVFGTGTFIALATLPLLMLMPESFLPVLLARKAAELRKKTGNPNIIAATDLDKKSLRYVLTVVLTRPFRMLLHEAIVACVCLYMTLVYAIYYLYFEAYPIIFQGPNSVYGFSPGVTGLVFLPIAVGSFFAAPVFICWDVYFHKARAAGKGWAQKEEFRRLPLACIGGPLYAIAIFWLGWSAKPDIHFMAPVMSGFLFGLGYFLVFMALFNYVSDAYLIFASSAQGIASTCRSIGGALLPLGSKRMYQTLGNSWACSLLGFLNFAAAAIPFFFIWYGERIRANSKFCNELKRIEQEEEKQRQEQLLARVSEA